MNFCVGSSISVRMQDRVVRLGVRCGAPSPPWAHRRAPTSYERRPAEAVPSSAEAATAVPDEQ
jgi:hypothetical protein